MKRLRVPPHLLARRPRARLSARLDATLAPSTRLTLVSAPPGYGKSVAVAGWAADADAAVAWASLDESDGDPARLALDLLAALAPVRPGAAAASEAVGPGSASDPRALADLVLGSVAADEGELVIVVDDAHHADGPDAAALLRRLVDRMPPFAHLVLVAREDPSLPLGRLRGHGNLLELRADDLRFTVEEACALIADAAGADPSADVVTRLVATTEGWAAALQLAAIGLGAPMGAGETVDVLSGTSRHLIDYLADEVMDGLDPGLRQLLEAAAIAGRIEPGLAEAMTGRADAADLLRQAERANLFLAPEGPDGLRLRMHGLFADYVRSRLEPAERRRLHGLAAASLAAAGRRRDALGHAIEAQAWELARSLLATEGRAALEAGEFRTLGRWIAALPQELRESDAEVGWLDAWSRFYTGDLAGAAAVAQGHSRTPRGPLAAAGRLMVLRAMVGTTTRSDAEDMALEGVEMVGDDALFRSIGLQAAGLARLATGDADGSLAILRSAFAEAEACGLAMAVLPAVNPLCHALVAAGLRDEAERTARRVLDAHPGPQGGRLPVAWSARLSLGIAMFEGGDAVDARGELEGGLAAAESLGVGREVLGWALPAIALARQATGDAAGALAVLTRTPRVAGFPSLAAETEARVRLAQGDLAWASRWADSAAAEAPLDSPLLALLEALARLTVARVRLAEGRPQEAGGAVREASAVLDARGPLPDRVSALVLAAAAAESVDADVARSALASAVALAAPGGYVRRFVEDGPRLGPLLTGLQLAPAHRAFADRVRAAMREAEAPPAGVLRGTSVLVAPDGTLVESLTARELDVMRLLATGARNAQLAAALGVSAGTAKWHVGHILAKLGASSRTAAVVRAHELGLV